MPSELCMSWIMIYLMNFCLDSVLWEESMKNGPGLSPWSSMYLSIDVTGQSEESTQPTMTLDPVTK